MKRISVFGLGYVGAVTAACLSRQGHQVIGVDVNLAKVHMLESGRATVLEPGLGELIAAGYAAGTLRATSDAATAVKESDISFVCVGTPSLPNGRLNVSNVSTTCGHIGHALRSKDAFHWVVIRSTVLPGTTRSVLIPALEAASGKHAGKDFGVCVNPEFTREGSAVSDFLNCSPIVIGADACQYPAPVSEIYQSFARAIADTSIEVAEMLKYVSNAFHALKIAFANEVGTLCRHSGVNELEVMKIFIDDTKLNISPAYLAPGFAFGGSCLPKDLRALGHLARDLDLYLPLLGAINASNQAHLDRAVESVLTANQKKIAVLGLSFKSGTDDLRESPSVLMIKRLLGEGCQVRIWDRDVSLGQLLGSNRQFIAEQLPHIAELLSTNLEEVVADAEVVVIVSKTLDIDELATFFRPGQIIIDLRCPAPRPVTIGAAYNDGRPENSWKRSLPLGATAV